MSKNPITLQHQGDHHLTKVQVDPATKEVSAGAILSFTENSQASIQLKDGKTKAEFAHVGDTHALKAGIGEGGTFGLEYTDRKKGNLALKVEGDAVSITEGKIPKAGLKISGDHHKVELELNEKGQPSGVLESKLTKTSAYRVEMENGRLTKAELVHTGKNHEMAVSAGLNGDVGVRYEHGKGNRKFSFSVEKRGEEIKARGGLKLEF